MDEIEVIQTIEELRKFLNDKNFMEIVVRQKYMRFKKFYKVALNNIFKEAEQQIAAKEVLKAVQKNSKLLNQNMKMMKNLAKIQNIGLIFDGVNLVSNWATFAILYEKLNSMEEEIVGAIEKVQKTLNKGTELHIKAEYNKVISDYQDMLDCRKKQKPYSEEQMRKLVDSLYVVLDMMIDSLKSDLIDNQEIILTLQDTSLLNVFHEKTNEKIHNELEKEISEMFNGIEGEDASKLYDSLHNQIQYA